MREGGEFRSLAGGGKKFLYSAPTSTKGPPEDDPFSFPAPPRATSNQVTPREFHMPEPYGGSSDINEAGMPPLDLDNVWSIRNMAVGSASKSVRSEPSTLKSSVNPGGLSTSSVYYSRHGGIKGKPGGDQREGINSQQEKTGTGPAKWSSSGHGLGMGARRGQPPTFNQASERTLQDSQRKFQNESFNRDINDF